VVHKVKTVGLVALGQVGLSRFVGKSSWRRRQLLILGYHGISMDDEHEWNPQLFMSPAQFERRLDLLNRTDCTVLPLDEAIQRLVRDSLPERAVCLTFDDGFFNFLTQVQPRLRRYGFPATVYLTTRRCEHNFPVVPIGLSYVLWKSGRVELDGSGLPGLGHRSYRIGTEDERQTLIDRMFKAVIAVSSTPEAQDDLLRQVSARVGADYAALAASRLLTLLRPAEVSALASEGADFQLHTHTHSTPPDSDLFVQQIRDNRSRIEAMTGVRPTHFCYPSGVYRDSYFPLLEAESVKSATTTRPGIATSDTRLLLMPRFIDTNLVSDAEFEAWLTGLAPLLRHTLPESAHKLLSPRIQANP
jgi:peptidoglycan/xylan/chitin deacetylase (PgdA/CDA1 family)